MIKLALGQKNMIFMFTSIKNPNNKRQHNRRVKNHRENNRQEKYPKNLQIIIKNRSK